MVDFTPKFSGGNSPFAGGYAKPYFDGYYAGLGAGIVSSMANIKTDIISTLGTNPTTFHNDFDLGKHGVNGNIFAGFGKTLDSPYYLGGEIFGNIFNPKMNGYYTGSEVKIDIKCPYSFGGDIRGGYIIYPRVMLYLLFGLDYAKFEVNTSYNPGSKIYENNFNRWRLGYTPGVGVEIGLLDHLSLRAQYDYTFYFSFSHSAFTSDTLPPPFNTYSVNRDVKVKPSRGLFTLKLSYLF